MDTTVTSSIDGFGDVTMFRTCEQCGCCSSACPITGKDNFNVRRILRHIELDLIDDVAESPFPWLCTTCGRCETACPNGIAILDIMRPLRAMSPAEYVPEETSPCAAACPAGIDVPGYVRLIAQGRPEEACKLILEKVPFPGVLGRVCMHPCETQCRRGDVNQPISICALKRYAADKANGSSQAALKAEAPTGRKVAVIGAGPAGLTAAFYLRKKGHHVTVFEARPKPGGMMRYGIPSYRLPEEVLDREINQVLSTGIQLELNRKMGRDLDLEGLQAQGFEVIFIATGLQESRKIEIKGADLEDVFWGVDFLRDVRDGRPIHLKEKLLVVGGGNVAVDVALTALRLGAGEVTMACLESREEMPASAWEIEQAREEGVRIMPSWGPNRILGEDGKVRGVELVQCTCVFDEKGAFCPSFGEMKETVEADQVILAVGQASDLSFLSAKDRVRCERGLIVVDPISQETGIPGVFAGGDVGKGPGAVIDAIAAGRRAAMSIDKFLGGDGVIQETLAERADASAYTGKREKGFADISRETVPHLGLEERRNNFGEVDLCLGEEQAVNEAKRCLQCDLEIRLAKKLEVGG